MDTGHAKNLANLETLIAFCTSCGASYAPTKAAIKLPALAILRTNANTAATNLTNAHNTHINAVNARQLAFEPLKKLCTKVVAALNATDATNKLVDDAKTINRKIQGTRKIDIAPPPPGSPSNANSVSQQSFDLLIDNFSKLIALVATEPTYTPAENELKNATLATSLTNLKNVNTTVINANTALNNSLIARNTLFYQPSTGLVDTALEVKNYLKSLYGASSPQFKQANSIKFKNYPI